MKSDAADQERLVALQAIDTDLDRLRHRRSGLPEVARVAELESRARVTADRLTAVAVEVADLRREQRKADNDVELVRERAARDRSLLDSGTIGDPKQLTSLQHELESLARRQSDLEDVELEVMERLDGAEKHQRDLEVERDAIAAEIAEAIGARDAALAELASREADLIADRTDAASQIPEDLRTLYERLRADRGGVGAARLHRGQCEGCRIELTAIDIDRIRQAPIDEVLRCEECQRILVRTAESGL